MQLENKNHIIIGKVGASHGVRGEVKVFSLSDFPERFNSLKKVFVGKELLNIESIRWQNNFMLMKFLEYSSREKAQTLTGRLLTLERKDAMPLKEGQYYIGDIIGLEAFDEKNEYLGTVTDILQTGSNDVYVLSKKGQAKQILVPALKSVVLDISLSKGKLLVRLPEEMD